MRRGGVGGGGAKKGSGVLPILKPHTATAKHEINISAGVQTYHTFKSLC